MYNFHNSKRWPRFKTTKWAAGTSGKRTSCLPGSSQTRVCHGSTSWKTENIKPLYVRGWEGKELFHWRSPQVWKEDGSLWSHQGAKAVPGGSESMQEAILEGLFPKAIAHWGWWWMGTQAVEDRATWKPAGEQRAALFGRTPPASAWISRNQIRLGDQWAVCSSLLVKELQDP